MTKGNMDRSPSRESVGGSGKLRWRSSHTSVRSHPRTTSSLILASFLAAATFQLMLWIMMAYILHGPETQAPSSNVIQETAQKPLKNKFPIAFGIPTVQREGKPDYFRRTILSLTQHGVPLDSIFVMQGGTSAENHTVLQNTKMELDDNADGDSEPHSYHTVPRDTHDISIDYELPATSSERVRNANADKPDRKRWRIQEAHDFMWLTQYMLNNTDAPYIAFHQDDALLENLERNFGNWSNIFSLLSTEEDKDGGNHSILSLYHDRYKMLRKKKPPEHPVCDLNVFCGMVSLVFQRDTLQHMLDWMQSSSTNNPPLWKQQPIDWSLESYKDAFNLTIPVIPTVLHIGMQSSLKGIKFGANGVKKTEKEAVPAKSDQTTRWKILHPNKNKKVRCSKLLRQPVVFGIFSLQQRVDASFATTVLGGTVRSMQTNCLGVNQIYITESTFQQETANAVDATTNQLSPQNDSFVVVAAPPPVSIHYNMSRPENDRLRMAWNDDDAHKQNRIDLAHSFMWMARYLLNHTTAPYIGFNQDDAYWESPLPDLGALHVYPIVSLYEPVLGVGLLFRRDTLQDFLDWMEPLFKEGPLDWTLQDYVAEKNFTIPIVPMIHRLTKTKRTAK